MWAMMNEDNNCHTYNVKEWKRQEARMGRKKWSREIGDGITMESDFPPSLSELKVGTIIIIKEPSR